jgi:hypothetical protein
MTERKNELGFTSKTWHELSEELAGSYVIIREQLAEKITLSDYGTGIQSILCFFVCLPYDDPNNEHERFYARDKGLDIVRKLDYDVFRQLKREDAVKMQAQIFLAALEKVKNRKKTLNDFDFKRFYQDVEKAFKEKNWV